MPLFSRRRLLAAGGLSALFSVHDPAMAASRETPPLPRRDPRALDLLPERLAVAGGLVAEAVAHGGVPGAVLLVARHGAVALCQAHGWAALQPRPRPLTDDTLFDLASLTKPVATATSVLRLIEAGRVELDAPIGRYLPVFAAAGGDKARITVRHLLTHSSGLPAGGRYSDRHRTTEEIVGEIAAGRQAAPPGEQFIYSDLGFITLGEMVEVVTGRPLNVYAHDEIFAPLGMADTGFLPGPFLAPRSAATAPEDTAETRGRVHDPIARAMGGVAGHAGLFSTAGDLARFCQMLLNGGEYGGARILRPETVALATTSQTPVIGNARGLGWDIDTGYAIRGALPPGSFGHTGFTGTSLWIDPTSETFIVLLTNAVHARPTPSVTPLRRAVSTAVAAALADMPVGPGRIPAALPAALDDRVVVQTGLDVLAAENFRRLEGRNVGVVCNHTAVDRQGRHIADLMAANKRVKIVALFGPEHSIRGDVDASASDSTDARTGLPVYSLYNLQLPAAQRYRPTPEQLAGINTLVFDIQDIGARFYTYIATLGYCLEAAAKQNIRMVVLDRPNPLGGLSVEGPLLDARWVNGFTSYHTMPITHGMTVGELARLFNAERGIGAELEVVAMPRWNRRLLMDQTGLPWVNPSPNIRNVREAALYPGVGMLETLPISVGRGTDTPFEILGAPEIVPTVLEANLSARRLPGVSFAPVRFTPSSSKHKGTVCGGVQILLWDRRLLRPTTLGVHLADVLARLYPRTFDAATLAAINRMVGDPATSEKIARGVPPETIVSAWSDDEAAWRRRRAPFLLYP